MKFWKKANHVELCKKFLSKTERAIVIYEIMDNDGATLYHSTGKGSMIDALGLIEWFKLTKSRDYLKREAADE